MSECFRLQRKQPQENKAQPTGCTAIKEPSFSNDLVKFEKQASCSVMEEYKPFMSQGFVCVGENSTPKPVCILRDTGASQSLLLEGVLPLSDETSTGSSVLLQGVELGLINVPLHNIHLKSDLVTGPVVVGVRPTLPFEGVSLLLGNDLAGDKVVKNPIVCSKPVIVDEPILDDTELYPTCAVTRAMAKKAEKANRDSSVNDVELGNTIFSSIDSGGSGTLQVPTVTEQKTCVNSDLGLSVKLKGDLISRQRLIEEQTSDPEVIELAKRALPPVEASKVSECYYHKDGVLLRKWRPPDAMPDEEWRVVHQIVVPQVFRQDIIALAHDTPMAGHLGITKTFNKILSHFYWPKLKSDVTQYCRSCHVCQVAGKPNQKVPPAPLQPIPAFEEPFSRILIDCVGPLPKTKSGNCYLLTVMCTSTRFPEAIPLRNTKVKTIVNVLAKFFAFVGDRKSVV